MKTFFLSELMTSCSVRHVDAAGSMAASNEYFLCGVVSAQPSACSSATVPGRRGFLVVIAYGTIFHSFQVTVKWNMFRVLLVVIICGELIGVVYRFT